MTFASIENSEYGGNPRELFQFDREGAQFWSYTSSDTHYTYLGRVFLATSMNRGRIEQSQDVKRNNLTITLPITTTLIQQYIVSPPTDRIHLTIYRLHDDDPDNEVILFWVGRIVNVEFKEETADIRCEPLDTSLERPTLRRLYQTSCPHVLYGSVCKVDPSLFLIAATISSINRLVITSAAFGAYPDGYLAGGYVEIKIGNIYNKRFITYHTGNEIGINLPIAGVSIGTVLNTYPGCTHNISICNSRFSNILNYGGQPFIPIKNPMNGTPIF